MNTRTLFTLVVVLVVSSFVTVVSAQEGRQQKLYVLSSADNDVTIIDVATNQIIGAIEVGELPHAKNRSISSSICAIRTTSPLISKRKRNRPRVDGPPRRAPSALGSNELKWHGQRNTGWSGAAASSSAAPGSSTRLT